MTLDWPRVKLYLLIVTFSWLGLLKSEKVVFLSTSFLIRTLQFALNGSQGWGISRKNHHTTVEIKKGSRYQVEGTKELK